MSFALIQVERGSLHECAFLALRMRTASYEAKFWDGLSVIFGFLCYNLIRRHGQMLRVVGSLLGSTRVTSLRFPVDKPLEFGYMGWKQLTQATRLTVRKDRKIKGFQLTR